MRAILFLFAFSLYAATPTLAPTANGLATGKTVSAYAVVTLDAGCTGGAGDCGTYSWTQIPNADTVTGLYTEPSPSVLVWSSHTTAAPTVTGAVFGQYTVQVTVTPASGSPSTAILVFGAVSTDSQDIVVSKSTWDGWVAPQIRLGANPWPLADDFTYYQVNMIGKRFGIRAVPYAANAGAYYPTWLYYPDGETGTVDMPIVPPIPYPPVNAVTGTGTQFQTVFKSTRTGYATWSGTTVTRTSGDLFAPILPGDQEYGNLNGKIKLGSTYYTIASVDNTSAPNTITLTTSAGTQTTPTAFIQERGGVVDISGTAVTRVSGNYFRASMVGAAILINGSTSRTISAVGTLDGNGNTTTATLNSAATATGADWVAPSTCDIADQNFMVIMDTPSGRPKYRAGYVNSCTTNTAATLTGFYGPNFPATTAPTKWWRTTAQEMYYWGASAPWNYYDNVRSMFVVWQQSGLNQHRDYFRLGADIWNTNPLLGGWYNAGSPRNNAMDGLAFRATEVPAMWQDLNYLCTLSNSYAELAPSGPDNDVRERASWLRQSALCGGLALNADGSANSTIRTPSLASNVLGIAAWSAAQLPTGNWKNYLGYLVGTATVITGSSTVEMLTGGYYVGWCDQTGSAYYQRKRVWFNVDYSNGDVISYRCKNGPTSTSITLTEEDGTTPKAYAATGCSSPNCTRNWQIGEIVGQGSQPYMHGIGMGAMTASRQAQSQAGNTAAVATLNTMIDAVSVYLTTGVAYWPLREGYYYCTTGPAATLDGLDGGTPTEFCTIANANSTPENVVAAVNLQGETTAGLADDYVRNPTTAKKNRIDGIFYNMWTGPVPGVGTGGGPTGGASGLNTAYVDIMFLNRNKYFAFFWAGNSGSVAAWPAARLGGLAAESLVAKTASYKRPSNANATTIVVTDPSGTQRTYTGCGSTSCTVYVDSRQASRAQMTITHTYTAGGTLTGNVGLI
jgi:hypothetical protein